MIKFVKVRFTKNELWLDPNCGKESVYTGYNTNVNPLIYEFEYLIFHSIFIDDKGWHVNMKLPYKSYFDVNPMIRRALDIGTDGYVTDTLLEKIFNGGGELK